MTARHREWQGPASNPIDVANRIALRRIDLGMTQQELADLLGIRQWSVAKFERQGASKVASLEALATALRCQPSWLAWG